MMSPHIRPLILSTHNRHIIPMQNPQHNTCTCLHAHTRTLTRTRTRTCNTYTHKRSDSTCHTQHARMQYYANLSNMLVHLALPTFRAHFVRTPRTNQHQRKRQSTQTAVHADFGRRNLQCTQTASQHRLPSRDCNPGRLQSTQMAIHADRSPRRQQLRQTAAQADCNPRGLQSKSLERP